MTELTLDEKIATLTNEHHKDFERKVDQLILRHNIKKALPNVGVPWKFYTGSRLYKSVASLYIEHDFYDYNNKKPQPTLETIIEASKHLKPISMTKCQDSCLSFQPTWIVDKMPEEKKKNWREETIVSPFIVEYDVFQNPQFTVKWFAELEGVGQVFVKIMIRLEREFGILYPIYEETKSERLSNTLIRTMHFDPPKEFITIFDEDEDPVGEMQSPITWASGSNTTPNRKLLYWIDLYLDRSPTIENLLTPIIKKMERI